MHYFVLEEITSIEYAGNYTEGGSNKLKIIKMADLSSLCNVDYILKNRLISDRLKLLLEMYLPNQSFTPIVFWNPKKAAQTSFWTFEPPLYEGCEVCYRKDNIPENISLKGRCMPIAFSVPPSKGVYSSIVNLAVAESILRRGILGLKLTKVNTAM